MAEGLTYIKAQASSGDACYHEMAGRKVSVTPVQEVEIGGLWSPSGTTNFTNSSSDDAGWSSGSSSGS
jgi:hypothetical protein